MTPLPSVKRKINWPFCYSSLYSHFQFVTLVAIILFLTNQFDSNCAFKIFILVKIKRLILIEKCVFGHFFCLIRMRQVD